MIASRTSLVPLAPTYWTLRSYEDLIAMDIIEVARAVNVEFIDVEAIGILERKMR